MEINGLPLHPLIVHAVVVFTPLAGVLVVLYAVVPRRRWLLRWPLAAGRRGGRRCGRDLRRRNQWGDLEDQIGIHGSLIENHETWAGRLQLAMRVLAAAALVAAYVMPFSNPLAARADRGARVWVLRIPTAGVLVLVGAATLFLVYLTGDSGARMVWVGRQQLDAADVGPAAPAPGRAGGPGRAAGPAARPGCPRQARCSARRVGTTHPDGVERLGPHGNPARLGR